MPQMPNLPPRQRLFPGGWRDVLLPGWVEHAASLGMRDVADDGFDVAGSALGPNYSSR